MTQRRQQVPRKIKARFIKSALCPTVYADGAWGSITSQGNIHMALFSESGELPVQTYTIDPVTYAPTEQTEPIGGVGGVVREIQAIAILSPNVAIAIRTWLDQQIPKALEAQALIKARMEQVQGESESSGLQ